MEPADARHYCRRATLGAQGSAGSVLVLGGSAGMTGAAALAALAAMRIGAGLVRLAVPRSLNDILEAKATEVVTLPVAETEGRSFTAAGMREALARAGTPQCVALGPGLSQHPETVRAVYEVLPTIAAPLVIDADGLNALAEAPETFDRLAGPAVITPHPGEMSRLLRRGVGEIQADRIAAATEAARRFGVVAVLKGARTVIAEPGGAVFINATGNAAMASAGMGDVLTGAIAGLIAQGLTPLDGAILGVFLHGLAGDLAATAVGGPGIVAGDVQERLPAALAALRGAASPHRARGVVAPASPCRLASAGWGPHSALIEGDGRGSTVKYRYLACSSAPSGPPRVRDQPPRRQRAGWWSPCRATSLPCGWSTRMPRGQRRPRHRFWQQPEKPRFLRAAAQVRQRC